MLPQMRHQRSSLVQLCQQRKAYNNHRIKLMNINQDSFKSPRQSLNLSINREKHIIQIKKKLRLSFNYNKSVRQKNIEKDNLILYKKIISNSRSIKKQQTPENNKSGKVSNLKSDKSINKTSFSIKQEPIKNVLRNHRYSPVNKTTAVDIVHQNLRLALNLHQQPPTISVKKLQKIHNEDERRKRMIMKYQSSLPKFTRYIEKKSSTSSFKNKFIRSSNNQEDKQENKQFTFSLTQYNY